MDGNACPECQRPYGKRRRCYFCNSPRKRTGEVRKCAQCGEDFYAAQWQLSDVARQQGTYCSKACLHESMRLQGPGARRVRWDGYIEVYYPKHPDSTKSGWMLEHRLVAEKKYGRRIRKDEHVHHLNHDPSDNREENLEVIDPGSHARISNAHGVEKRADLRKEVVSLRAKLAEYERRFGPLT